MKPELVGKVRRDLQSAWTDIKDPDDGWWDFMARYALTLAERAARNACDSIVSIATGPDAEPIDAEIVYRCNVATNAVERAVEGGA